MTLHGGVGTATTSGGISIRTMNAGTIGVSGALVFSTGTTSKGDSGSLSLGSGTSTDGKAGGISITVGDGLTRSAQTIGNTLTVTGGKVASESSSVGGGVVVKGGEVTHSTGTGGDVTLQAGKSTDASGTHGSVVVKDGSGTTIVTMSDTTFTVDTAAVDIDASGALALTGLSGVTIGASTNYVSVTSNLKVSYGKSTYLEGGLSVGQDCSTETCHSSTFTTLERAAITRVLKGSQVLDFTSNAISAGTETISSIAISSAVAGNMVMVAPAAATTSAEGIIWSAWVIDGFIKIRITNTASSSSYAESETWYFLLFQYTL